MTHICPHCNGEEGCDDEYEGPPEEVEKYYWADKCWRERREEHELTFSRREGK